MPLDEPRSRASPIVALLALACFGCPPVAAQSTPPAADPLDAAFAASMARPSDPNLALRYARIAAERGDARAAIVALERVLRIDPSLDNIRLEIASLYLSTGSSDLAALYARQALASPAIPPEAAVRAREILAQAERGAARSLLDASIFVGGRWESNANAVTSAGTVPIFVPPLNGFLPAQIPASGESDSSLVLSARIAHRYDLELQREGSWETNAYLFDQRFASIPRAYDLTITSLDTGPRIGVADVGENGTLALRPFVSASWLGYADDTYAWLYGGGLTAELRYGARWTFELTALGRFGNYENSDFRPTARDYTGAEMVLIATASYLLTRRTQLTASLSYVDADARKDFYARSGTGGLVGVQTSFQVSGREIGFTARGGWRALRYDAPDPVLDPFNKRDDTRWEAGAALIVPLLPRLAAILEYEFYDQQSNYQIYRFDNHAVTLGLRMMF